MPAVQHWQLFLNFSASLTVCGVCGSGSGTIQSKCSIDRATTKGPKAGKGNQAPRWSMGRTIMLEELKSTARLSCLPVYSMQGLFGEVPATVLAATSTGALPNVLEVEQLRSVEDKNCRDSFACEKVEYTKPQNQLRQLQLRLYPFL